MKQFLEQSHYLDWADSNILQLARSLSSKGDDDEKIARKCFEWVRDNIMHSNDFKMNPVTCKASDVLKYKTGYCYAKSHLLVALLRANEIPAGLCYQRLSINKQEPPFCLHGLTAVHLKKHGWYRVDPRGNKKDINAQFVPPVEQLAFPICLAEEADLPEIWSEPHPQVISALENHDTYDEVYKNLPDMKLLPNL